jgi:hypothetical protein
VFIALLVSALEHLLEWPGEIVIQISVLMAELKSLFETMQVTSDEESSYKELLR